MSKAIINQRYIYKIHSSRFKVNDWNLTLPYNEAKDNSELVSIGDSIALRMIRKMRKYDTKEDYIIELKKSRKKLRNKKTSDSIRGKIKVLDNEINEITFMKDYITIVFDNIADWKRANSKKKSVILNGVEFLRLVGTNGGIKKNTVVFCAKEIHKELDRKLNNGRNLEKIFNPSKFEAYKALAFSGSTSVTQPKKILVIKDGETQFTDNIIRVYDDGKDGYKVKETDNYEVIRAFTDGCAPISIRLAKQWTIDMGISSELDFMKTPEEEWYKLICSGFNIRNAWTKGMAFPFEYVEFAEEIAHTYMVKDIWGDMQDIREVDLILTDNMLKLWDSYDSADHYMQCCKENDFEFCVAKALPLELENTRNMNYQFLQSYDFSDDDIDNLIAPTLETINGVGEGNYIKTLLFLKGNRITENDFKHEQIDYMKALMIEKSLINDPFIKQMTTRMISKRINDSKKGVLQVNGCYSIVSGDLYALCESMFGMEVKGLLGRNEFYANTWSEKGINKIVSYRAPQTNHNNIKIMNLIYTDEVRKWFKYMRTCTILNAWDMTCEAMNGMDEDGDALIETDNETLLKTTRNLKAIVCEQSSASKHIISEKNLIQANQNGFNNDVGSITNKCTAMFDVLAGLENGTVDYKEMNDRIICMQNYQQSCIDSCKGIVAKQVPKSWYSWKDAKKDTDKEGILLNSQEDIEDRAKLLRLGSFKKPYFFIYNYKHIKSKYDNYVKESKTDCIIRFGITLDVLMSIDNKTEEQINYLKYYYLLLPVSVEKSTMNRICWRLEEKIIKLSSTNENELFDKEILKTTSGYNKANYNLIAETYKEYKIDQSIYMKSKKNKMTSEELREKREGFMKKFRNKALSNCTNEEELCNIVVDLCYTSNESKMFAWAVSGNQIIKNLLKKNNNIILIPTQDDDGDTEWLGSMYTLNEINLLEDGNKEGIEC